MADAATVSVLLRADDQLSGALRGAQNKIRDFGRSAGEAGRGLLALSAPLVAIGALSLKAFTDFESSFAGVRKTVDATEEQFQELAAGFRKMALQIPVNVNELNRIGEAAGQLGIKVENIEFFTRTMADLGVATNMSSDQAATALARLANITGLPQRQVDRLGSAIVELGNNLATTESEIVDFGLRIAGAGTIAGLTEAQIMGISGAMSSVGVQAEAGGTAVQKVLLAMTQQVATSGEQLKTFASTAGMTADQFSKAFKEDAAGAFTAFVEGLGRAGTDAFAILAELGLEDQRLMRSFLSLAGAGDKLRTSLEMGTRAFAENTALTEEAEKRYATAANQFNILKNHLQDVAITVGETLMPPLLNLVKAVKPIVAAIGEWAERNPKLTVVIIALGFAVATLGTALVGLSLVLPGIVVGFGLLAGIQWAAIAGGIASVGTATAAIVTPVTAAAVAAVAFGAAFRTIAQTLMIEGPHTWEAIWKTFTEDVKGHMKSLMDSVIGLTPTFDDMTSRLQTVAAAATVTASTFDGITASMAKLASATVETMQEELDLLRVSELLGTDFNDLLANLMEHIKSGLEPTVAWQVELALQSGRVKLALEALAATVTGGTALLAAMQAQGVSLVDMFNRLSAAAKIAAEIEMPITSFDQVRAALEAMGRSIDPAIVQYKALLAAGWESEKAWKMMAATIESSVNKELDELAAKLVGGKGALDAMRGAGASWAQMFTELSKLTLEPLRKSAEEVRKEAEAAAAAIETMTTKLDQAIRAQYKAPTERLREQLAALEKEFAVTTDPWRRWEMQAQLTNMRNALAVAIQAQAASFALFQRGVTPETAYLVRGSALSPPSFPDIPAPSFQYGGIVTRPTLAFLGERGPEAVVPLGRGRVGNGLTINTTINGPIFGEQDMEDKIAQIWRDVARAGGFRGLI